MLIKTSLNECFTSHIVHSFQQICSALSYAWFRLNNIIVDNYDTDGSKALLNPVILRTRSKPFIRIYSSALYLSIRLAQNISFWEREVGHSEVANHIYGQLVRGGDPKGNHSA